MSSKFNINDYLDKKVAVHCDTEEKARIFRTCLAQHGLSWCSGVSYLSKSNWCEYKEHTCYNFHDGSYAYTDWYRERHYLILEFDDFNWTDYGYRSLRGDDLLKILEGSK